MIKQVTFHLSAKRRGCHLITSEVLGHLPKPLPQVGLLHLFVSTLPVRFLSMRMPIRMYVLIWNKS